MFKPRFGVRAPFRASHNAKVERLCASTQQQRINLRRKYKHSFGAQSKSDGSLAKLWVIIGQPDCVRFLGSQSAIACIVFASKLMRH